MLILFGLFVFLLTVPLLFALCIYLLLFLFKRRKFPKKLLIATFSGFFIVNFVYIYKAYFFTFNDINKTYIQEGMGPIESPNQSYTAKVYYEPYGGAMGGVNVWVEVTNQKKDEVKVIYYADAKVQVVMQWVDETALFIQNDDTSFPNSNRSITLDVEKEIYHEFGLACQSVLMKKDYEVCYQNE